MITKKLNFNSENAPRYEIIYNHLNFDSMVKSKMFVYTMHKSYITYNFESFCDVKKFITLVPCHINKQKLNEKKHNGFLYVLLFHFKVVCSCKKIIMPLKLTNWKKIYI